MFIDQGKPTDFDCGYNLDLMIAALPRIKDEQERIAYAKRIVGLIKQSHTNWVRGDGTSYQAWDHYFALAEYDPREYGIENPFDTGGIDDAK